MRWHSCDCSMMRVWMSFKVMSINFTSWCVFYKCTYIKSYNSIQMTINVYLYMYIYRHTDIHTCMDAYLIYGQRTRITISLLAPHTVSSLYMYKINKKLKQYHSESPLVTLYNPSRLARRCRDDAERPGAHHAAPGS